MKIVVRVNDVNAEHFDEVDKWGAKEGGRLIISDEHTVIAIFNKWDYIRILGE